jgi:hypothetical protein
MNVSGKDWITSHLATKIMQIFTTRKPKHPNFLLGWQKTMKKTEKKEVWKKEGIDPVKKLV